MRRNDLTGRRFGLLTAIRPTEDRRCKCVVWLCRCECGACKAVPSTDLTRGRVKSCGCLCHRCRDISGERRGRLTALRPTGQRDKWGGAIYLWRCDCGALVTRSARSTDRDSAMCPACRSRILAEDIARVRNARALDTSTGLPHRYLENLVREVPTASNTSGCRGVYWHAGHKRWCAEGSEHGVSVRLGEFEDYASAVDARRRFVERVYATALQKTITEFESQIQHQNGNPELLFSIQNSPARDGENLTALDSDGL